MKKKSDSIVCTNVAFQFIFSRRCHVKLEPYNIYADEIYEKEAGVSSTETQYIKRDIYI